MSSRDSFLHRQIDEYQVVKLLGKGGMARVYQAVDVRLNRKVALKVIDKPHRSKSDYIHRFKQEAQAIGRLEHPRIVRLYRYGETEDLIYMVMQYIEGLDLAQLLDSYRRDSAFMELEELTRILHEICEGLDHSHVHGVIHRDLKPSNIMIDRHGHAVLTDFGLAMLAEVTTEGQVLGSVDYISPEQAVSSANAVPQSDLYSAGVILFEILTGEVPFKADDPLASALMHIEDPVPLPSSIRPDLGREIDRVLLKCLHKNPENRYQTGAELAQAFDTAVRGGASDTQKTFPGRMTIPERVLIGESLQGSAGNPPPPEAPPGERSNWPGSQFSILLGAGAILLLVILCVSLVGGSAVFAGMLGQQSTPTASSTQAATLPPLKPTVTPSPTDVPASPSPTTTATAEFTPEPTPTSTANLAAIELTIASYKDDSMVIRNDSEKPFFLPLLVLKAGKNTIEGTVWEVDLLEPGECVVAVKNTGNPKMPRIECDEVGERQYVARGDRLWDKDFEVIYDGTLLAKCSKSDDECEVVYENGNG